MLMLGSLNKPILRKRQEEKLFATRSQQGGHVRCPGQRERGLREEVWQPAALCPFCPFQHTCSWTPATYRRCAGLGKVNVRKPCLCAPVQGEHTGPPTVLRDAEPSRRDHGGEGYCKLGRLRGGDSSEARPWETLGVQGETVLTHHKGHGLHLCSKSS